MVKSNIYSMFNMDFSLKPLILSNRLVGSLFILEGVIYLVLSYLGVTDFILGLGFLEIVVGLMIITRFFVITATDDDNFSDVFLSRLTSDTDTSSMIDNEQNLVSFYGAELRIRTFANISLLSIYKSEGLTKSYDEVREMIFGYIKDSQEH